MNLTQVPISMIDTVAGDAGKVLTSDGSTLNWVASSAITPSTGIAAWVNFDGTKDTTGATSTANTNRLIRASSNVTSVLRNAAGDYTITLASSMGSANFAVIATSQYSNTRGDGANQHNVWVSANPVTATTLNVITIGGATYYDIATCSVVVIV